MITGLRRGIDSPINPSYAYSPELTVPWPLAGHLSKVHGIDPWVAGLLIRPMLADLAEVGSWRYDTAKRYVVQDGLCHCFFLEHKLHRVTFYLADHGQKECLATPSPPPPEGRSTWFCPVESPAPPPEGNSHNAWRHLLRTAAHLPMRLSQLAFLDFARLAPGAGFVPPDTFLSTFEAMAEQSRIVHTRLPGGPGTVNITVGSQAWTVRRGDTADPHCKPYVRSIQHFQDPATLPEAGTAAPVSLLSQPPASLRR
ncbi:hypothetical protein [Streptomyces phaeochromogenes]|uniref:hypothetical protein n=1 Tax=Streptomyces phaeochromogenes TaxID=1923 RepID=UPI002DDB3158|nr:hypothetical protein [Streptomyces phaeochromogenes]WRZ28730.1 hypothetical protein OG931_13685 [Streptomyces phaeochromogenes]